MKKKATTTKVYKSVTQRIPVSMSKAIDRFAKKLKESRSTTIRMLLADGLKGGKTLEAYMKATGK